MKHITLLLILLAIGFGSVLVIGPRPKQVPADSQTRYTIDPNAPTVSPQRNLQLRTIPFITVAQTTPTVPPTPTTAVVTPTPPIATPTLGCYVDVNHSIGLPIDPSCPCVGAYKTVCKDGHSVSQIGPAGQVLPPSNGDQYCRDFGITDGTYCEAKPVIYLYPTERLLVDVQIQTIGKIVVSDPFYPEEGWQRVEAYPSGQLYYQGKPYTELFYETLVDDLMLPQNGIIIKTEYLQPQLENILTQLGLNAKERDAFLSWWLPHLKAVNTPYMLFSILDAAEKGRTDTVFITPKPDTFIGFIAYFKPLSKPYFVTPLILPSTPKRVGFTAVEWGGVLDTNNTFTLY